MPRRYYRSRKIIVRPKQKWNPVLKEVHVSAAFAQNSTSGVYYNLIENSSDTSVPTPTVIKTGHFKVCIDVTSSNASFIQSAVYVMYVPEGWGLPTEGSNSTSGALLNLPSLHPEWIMCWRTVDVGSAIGGSIQMSSRLKRNLNSGDRIIVIYKAHNLATSASTAGLTIITTYVCRAN